MTPFTRLKNRLRNSKALIITITAVLLFATQQLNAQAPGYMGQRIMIGGYLGAFPSIWNYNANMKQGFTSFNFRKTIEAEYVASRRVVIGLHYDFMNIGTATDFYDVEDPNIFPTEKEDPNYQMILSRGIGMQVKLFKTQSKGALAPIGNYFAWNFSFVNYKVWNLKKDDYNTLTRQVYESDGPKFMVGIEWGNQKVFFDRVVLRSGFQCSLLTGFGADGLEQQYLRDQRIAYAASVNLGLSLIVPYRQKVN